MLKITKENRNKLESEAELVRESGKLKEAEKMFLELIEWDKKNNNTETVHGVDIYGHLSITYKLLGDQAEKSSDKISYYEKSVLVLNSALKRAPKLGAKKGRDFSAILNVHLASRNNVLAQAQKDKAKAKASLKKALKALDLAIKDLPGSQAHKAWPQNIKANILYALGKEKEALRILNDAEINLYEGYADELEDINGATKLKVWLSGILLTKALIYTDKKMPHLALQYAQAVINIEDPTGVLGVRKSEAKRILEKIPVKIFKLNA